MDTASKSSVHYFSAESVTFFTTDFLQAAFRLAVKLEAQDGIP